jgi:hypothetical protein
MIFIILPSILCIYALNKWGPQIALRNVCLPILLLCPTYFFLKLSGVPGLDFGTTALLPLGLYVLFSGRTRWKFTRTDLWIGAYMVSCFYADFLAGEASMAKYRLFYAFVRVLFPYLAGKLLIEQSRSRMKTVRMIVGLLCVTCIFSIPEYFIHINLFLRWWIRFFPGQWPGWITSMRWGFARVAGPFGSPEVAGMIFTMGIMLSLWLRNWSPGEPSFRAVRSMPLKRAVRNILLTMLVTLFMTESRGPWIGAILALPIALVGRSRRVVRTAIIVATLFVAVGIPAYLAAKQYSSGPRKDYGSDRETAQYRQELLDNYIPLAQMKGAWGWGHAHPIIGGQISMDNEFLRIYLDQGYVGLSALVLLILETGYVLLRVGFTTRSRPDRHFAFSLLGIVCGWAFTIYTVYLGSQSFELFFLMVGWAQGLAFVPAAAQHLVKASEAAPVRQMTRVYT